MKLRGYIGIVLALVVLVGCGDGLPRPAATPSQRGTTSPRPSPSGEGVATLMLESIDSLMWKQPDSALKVIMEFAASTEADSLDVFEGHYCQVLVAELLFKNYYKQINRTEVLKAVGYFDSIVGTNGADTHGVSPQRGVSVQERDAFLAARAHYINGAGYYERDSLIEACGEYLNALRMMESHFGENELVDKKARFMALTYNRLGDLFSEQYMQEAAIYCIKRSLIFDRIAHSSPNSIANTIYHLGKEYGKLNVADSAAYYYEKALEIMPDRNSILYRDVIVSMALLNSYHDAENSLDSLKRMAALSENEMERLNRFLTIGAVYQSVSQYDSAKVYLEPVFERDPDRVIIAARYLREIALIEGDTLKANQYSQILAEEAAAAPENLFRASQLNDLFQNYLQEKQEMALALERQEARRRNLWIGGGVALLTIVGLAVAIVTRRSHRKRLAAQEAEAQRRLDEASKRLNEASRQLTEASQRHDETERELQTKVEQAAQHTREVLQQRTTAIYHSEGNDKLPRILNEFAIAYPQASERLMAISDLKEQERNIIVLSFLHFRAKEIADLLGLSENTVLQYRSNVKKKMGSDLVSDLIG